MRNVPDFQKKIEVLPNPASGRGTESTACELCPGLVAEIMLKEMPEHVWLLPVGEHKHDIAKSSRKQRFVLVQCRI